MTGSSAAKRCFMEVGWRNWIYKESARIKGMHERIAKTHVGPNK